MTGQCRACGVPLEKQDLRDGLCSWYSKKDPDHTCYNDFQLWVNRRYLVKQLPHLPSVGGAFDFNSAETQIAFDQWLELGRPMTTPEQSVPEEILF